MITVNSMMIIMILVAMMMM